MECNNKCILDNIFLMESIKLNKNKKLKLSSIIFKKIEKINLCKYNIDCYPYFHTLSYYFNHNTINIKNITKLICIILHNSNLNEIKLIKCTKIKISKCSLISNELNKSNQPKSMLYTFYITFLY